MSLTTTNLTTTNRTTHTPLPPLKPYIPLRLPTSRKTIYDRNLLRNRQSDLSLASFAHIFNSLISYHQLSSPSVSDLERRLSLSGYSIGVKLLDLLLYRASTPSKPAVRPVKLLELLQFIHSVFWKALFGKPADALELSSTSAAEYMISDNEPVVNKYISVPKDMSQLNCAAYVAGMIEGVCDAAGFTTGGVTAHSANEATDDGEKDGKSEKEVLWPDKTIYLIRFGKEVVEREELVKTRQ